MTSSPPVTSRAPLPQRIGQWERRMDVIDGGGAARRGVAWREGAGPGGRGRGRAGTAEGARGRGGRSLSPTT